MSHIRFETLYFIQVRSSKVIILIFNYDWKFEIFKSIDSSMIEFLSFYVINLTV